MWSVFAVCSMFGLGVMCDICMVCVCAMSVHVVAYKC